MAGDDAQIGQDQIENLLKQGQQAGTASPEPAAAESRKVALDQSEIEALMKPQAKGASASSGEAGNTVGQADVERLLNQAQQALASLDEGSTSLPPGTHSFELKDFVGKPASTESATLELMQDVELDLSIELGRTHMQLEDVLRLGQGAVVTLDKLAGDPVDILVNGRLIARGEVLVLNDNFCVRVAELIVGESADA